jgi:hypothetical protein
MLRALEKHCRIGVTAIGDSPEQSHEIYLGATELLDSMAARGGRPSGVDDRVRVVRPGRVRRSIYVAALEDIVELVDRAGELLGRERRAADGAPRTARNAAPRRGACAAGVLIQDRQMRQSSALARALAPCDVGHRHASLCATALQAQGQARREQAGWTSRT